MSVPVPSEEKPARELTSWKEIADYLGVTVRTTQAWELSRELPVKRSSGSKGRVSADPVELDRWKQANLRKKEWWNKHSSLRRYAFVITSLFLIVAGLSVANYLQGNRKGAPAMSRLESNFLVVTDGKGRELWRKHFPHPFSADRYSEGSAVGNPWVWFGNLDEDSGLETVFVYHSTSRDQAGTALICFGENGREKWRFLPGRPVSDGASTHSRIYTISSFLVADVTRAGFAQVLVSSHHVSSYPNQFVLVSGHGTVLGEYWHSGHLTSLDVADLDGDGREEILLAGFNSGYHQATLVVLDPNNVRGASVQQQGDIHQLRGFPPATEKSRILFPRTCMNLKFEEFNRVDHLTVREGLVQVGVAERSGHREQEVIYTLDGGLRITDIRYSDNLRTAHRELESSRLIDHALSAGEIHELRKLRVIEGAVRHAAEGQPTG